MIKDLLLTDGDISIKYDIEIVTDANALVQCAIENISIPYGSMQLTPTRGNKLLNKRIKLVDSNIVEIQNYCEEAVLYDTRIKSVGKMKATISGQYTCDITFQLITIDSIVIDGSTTISLL